MFKSIWEIPNLTARLRIINWHMEMSGWPPKDNIVYLTNSNGYRYRAFHIYNDIQKMIDYLEKECI